MATRSDVTAKTVTVTVTAPVGQPKTTATLAPKMPATNPAKKLAPAMPKTPANNNAATGLRHWIVGNAVFNFVAQHGPLSFIPGDQTSWDKMWDDVGDACNAALAAAGMPELTGPHQLKCYIPGFVSMRDAGALYGRSVKPWDTLGTKWLDLVKSGLVDSGTFTDIMARMNIGKLNESVHARIVALNGDKNAVRALLASL